MRLSFSTLKERATFPALLFLAALAVRLAYSLAIPESKISPDAHDWMNTAWSVAQGHGFAGSWRPPGYVFFLSGIFFVFGKSVTAARVVQALIGALTCLLTYKTGRRIFSETPGRIAGAMAVFYPYFIAYGGDLLCETLLAFTIALAVHRIVKSAGDPSVKNLALTGLFMGLAALTKSTILPFFLLACAWLWWRTGRFRSGLLAGVFMLLSILPWSLRNYFSPSEGRVMPVSTPWLTFYVSTCDGAYWQETLGEMDSPMSDELGDKAEPPDLDAIFHMPVVARDKYCRDKALAWIAANPAKYRTILSRRLAHFWRLYPQMAYKWQKYSAMLTSGLYIPLCLIGFFLARSRFGNTSLLLALFASYTAVHLFFLAMIRYRVPIDSFIMIMAAYTVYSICVRFRVLGPDQPAGAQS